MLLLGTVETVRGTYEFQGRRFDLQRGGTLRFIGEPQIESGPRRHRDARPSRTPASRRACASPARAKAPQLDADEQPAARGVRHPRADRLQPAGQRAGHRRARLAGGDRRRHCTGFIAAPLGESIGRALDLDLFEITTTTDEGDLGAGLTLGQQVGDRAFFKLRQQFGERNTTEFLLEYQLAEFLRLQTTAAPETSGSANRIGQRRIERAGIDLIFFFSY